MPFRARGKEIINSLSSVESVHANMLTKLWENPNPTASFGPQTIALSSDDYDFTLTVARRVTSYQQDVSTITAKGDSIVLNVGVAGGSGATTAWRRLDYVSDTSLSAIDCKTATGTSAATTDNTQLIPIAIYGFKKSIDITAIVSNVSTDASKCMLSNGVSVETALGDTTSWTSLGTSVISCQYRKKNGVVFVRFSGTNVTVAASETIGTLPVGFRPLSRITLRNAFTGNNDASFYINTDGTVLCVSTSAGGGRYIEGIASYPL